MEAKEQIVLIDIFHVSQGLRNVLTPTPDCTVGRSRSRFFLDRCNAGVRVVHLQRRDCACSQRGNPHRWCEY